MPRCPGGGIPRFDLHHLGGPAAVTQERGDLPAALPQEFRKFLQDGEANMHRWHLPVPRQLAVDPLLVGDVVREVRLREFQVLLPRERIVGKGGAFAHALGDPAEPDRVLARQLGNPADPRFEGDLHDDVAVDVGVARQCHTALDVAPRQEAVRFRFNLARFYEDAALPADAFPCADTVDGNARHDRRFEDGFPRRGLDRLFFGQECDRIGFHSLFQTVLRYLGSALASRGPTSTCHPDSSSSAPLMTAT